MQIHFLFDFLLKINQLLNKELEHKFISEFQENQNIVHKVCRIYTSDQESHNDLFQEITIQLWNA